jgi:signal transduction histidine kinase
MLHVFNTAYHPKLVKSMTRATMENTTLLNSFLSLTFIAVLYTHIPDLYLFSWAAGQFLLITVRHYEIRRLDDTLKSDLCSAQHYLNYHLYLVIASGVMWGAGTFLTVWFAPMIYHFFPLILSAGITAGALPLLGPVFHIYFAYTLAVLLPLSVALFSVLQPVHIAMSLLVIAYLVTLYRGALAFYKNLQKSLELQQQLQELNDTLQNKVNESIETIRRKDQQMIQQSRFAQMGEMLSMIAHQWRQPLNIIGLQIQDLKDAYAYGELNEHYLNDMVERSMLQVNYMSETIDDFKKFFLPNRKRQHFSVQEAIDRATHLLTATLTSYRIELTCRGKDFTLYGAQNEFIQVMINLIGNAKDIFAHHAIENPLIAITLTNRSVEIEDNAGGIDERIIDRIFEPYFTTKESLQGTGLGLYMSKGIVEAMSGTITVKNGKQGAIFRLTFAKVS